MNRLILWVVNVGLLLLAAAVTVWVVRQAPTPGAVAVEGRGDGKTSRSERKAERKPGTKESAEGVTPHAPVSAADSDVLWQQTLFRPERTENLTEATADAAAAAGAALNLELVGLARIGERAVAVIMQHRGQTVRRPGVVVVGLPAGMARSVSRAPSVAPAPAEGAAPSPEGPPDRHVYKVGDKVGDSGYTLKDIRLKEKEVVLVRGSEERVLKLETNDDESTTRRETAAVVPPPPKPAPDAAGAPKPGGVAGAAVPATPGGLPPGVAPPPAPPVAVPGAGPAGAVAGAPPATTGAYGPAGRDTPGASPMSREERLERARLLRERILQGRPSSGTSN